MSFLYLIKVKNLISEHKWRYMKSNEGRGATYTALYTVISYN